MEYGELVLYVLLRVDERWAADWARAAVDIPVLRQRVHCLPRSHSMDDARQ